MRSPLWASPARSSLDSQEPQITQWVWVFDFHGYGLWDNNPSTVVAAAQFLPLHPNRLYKVIMLDAPTAFSAIWGVVSGFLTDITKAKITFTSLAQLRDVAAGWTGDELASWLGAEAPENRALTAAGARGAGAQRSSSLPRTGAARQRPRRRRERAKSRRRSRRRAPARGCGAAAPPQPDLINTVVAGRAAVYSYIHAARARR